MPLYLSESMIGAGTLRNPFKARGADQPGAGTIYLGDTGKTLLWLPAVSSDLALTLLALDKADTIGPATRTTLASKLNLTLTLQKASDLLAEILLTPGKGWNPIKADRFGMIEIWIEGVLWHSQVAVKGGATDSSAFTGTEASPMTESGKWLTEGAWGGMQKNGNAYPGASGTNAGARCTTDMGSDDTYSQANMTVASTPQYPALTVRMATNVSYYGEVGVGDNFKLYKSDSSLAFTEIGSGSGTPTSGQLFYFEVSGSNLTLKANGSTVRGPTSDPTITSGHYVGMAGYANGAVTNCTLDNWEGGSLGGGGGPPTRIKDMIGLDMIPKKR